MATKREPAPRPLNKTQINVLRSMLNVKIMELREEWRTARQAQFEIDNAAFETASKEYAQKVAEAELAEVRRRPNTYICGGSVGCRVMINKEKLDEYIAKKFGPAPVRPTHPSNDNVVVLFPALSNEHGYHAQVDVPRPYKNQFEALSHRINSAVLNGSCDGLVDAINALG